MGKSNVQNLSSNFIVMQDYVNDSFSESKTIYGRQIPLLIWDESKRRTYFIAWHLTQKEKLYICSGKQWMGFNIAAFCNLLTDKKS